MDELQLAGCILLDKSGAMLLLHRNTDKYNHWEVPGGKIEPGESEEEAAIREIKEELGIGARIARKLGCASFVDGRPMKYHWFLAETDETPRVCEPDKFEELAYFALSELINGNMSLSEGAKMFVSLVDNGTIRV